MDVDDGPPRAGEPQPKPKTVKRMPGQGKTKGKGPMEDSNAEGVITDDDEANSKAKEEDNDATASETEPEDENLCGLEGQAAIDALMHSALKFAHSQAKGPVRFDLALPPLLYTHPRHSPGGIFQACRQDRSHETEAADAESGQ